MSPRYELVDWENLGYNLPHSLPHPTATTIAEAVSNIRSESDLGISVSEIADVALAAQSPVEFTHASGTRKHTRFPGGLLAMWQFLEGKKEFPSKYLVKLPQTLSE